jgi:hypothetical protein
MTTMNGPHPTVAPLALILTLNDGLVERAFAGVATDDLWKRPTPQSNPMLWIWGHVVTMRARLLNLLGDEFGPGLGEVFARGASLQDASGYPDRTRIDRPLAMSTSGSTRGWRR